MVILYTTGMSTCPKCAQARYQVKDGFTSAGSQRMRCQACGARYTPTPKVAGYTPELRTQALKMYVDGLNFRRIGRLLGVHHQTVINWVTAAAEHVPSAVPSPTDAATVELDELYTFVGQKKNGSMS